MDSTGTSWACAYSFTEGQSHDQVLVTHHVDLVLPTAYYLVSMANGRIETQGTVEELRERGVLGPISTSEQGKLEERLQTQLAALRENTLDAQTTTTNMSRKTPKVLVEEERRAIGQIKWLTYKRYLEASYDISVPLLNERVTH